MDIYKEIMDHLKAEYEGGATYQEMSKKYGISYQYLREIMLGIKPIERMSLAYLFKLFPHATLNLQGAIISGGSGVNAGSSSINNGVMGVNNGTVNAVGAAPVEAFRDRALKVLMDLDLPPDALLKVLKTLKDLPIKG